MPNFLIFALAVRVSYGWKVGSWKSSQLTVGIEGRLYIGTMCRLSSQIVTGTRHAESHGKQNGDKSAVLSSSSLEGLFLLVHRKGCLKLIAMLGRRSDGRAYREQSRVSRRDYPPKVQRK